MIREHDSVVLLQDLPGQCLVAGDVGVVVHVHDRGYEVEFTCFDGSTIGVLLLEAADVRPLSGNDMPHARTLPG